jgi:hypothetical protein
MTGRVGWAEVRNATWRATGRCVGAGRAVNCPPEVCRFAWCDSVRAGMGKVSDSASCGVVGPVPSVVAATTPCGVLCCCPSKARYPSSVGCPCSCPDPPVVVMVTSREVPSLCCSKSSDPAPSDVPGPYTLMAGMVVPCGLPYRRRSARPVPSVARRRSRRRGSVVGPSPPPE